MHTHSETVSTHWHNKQIRGVQHYDEPPPTPFARLTEVRDFRVLRVCDTFSYPHHPSSLISLSLPIPLLSPFYAPFVSPFAELCDLFMRLEHKTFPYPTPFPFPYPIPFLYPSASGDICICVRRQQPPRTMNC